MNTLPLLDSEFVTGDLLDQIPIGVVNVNVEGTIIFVNTVAQRILDLDKESLEGKKFDQIQWPQVDIDGLPIQSERQPLSKALKEERKITDFIQGIVKPGGKIVWISIHASPLYSAEGILLGGISSFIDISDKVELEREYKVQSVRTKHIEDSVQAVFWEWSFISDSMVYVGPKIGEMLGFTQEERSAKGFWEANLHIDDKKDAISFHKEQVAAGKSHELEYRFRKSNGDYIWIRDIIEVVVEDERPIFLRGLMMDITRQKTLTKQLDESDERYRNLINEAPFSISLYNMDGVLVNANEAFETTWDIEKEGLIGKFNILKEGRLNSAKMQLAAKHAFEGKKGDLFVKFETVKARIKELHIKYFPLYNSNKEIYNIVFVTEDITARQEAEHKARMGEALQQGILNSLEDAILVVDKDGVIISLNKRLEHYLQKSPYSNVKIGGNVFSFIGYFEEKGIIKNGLEKVLNRSATFFDYETKLADKKWYNLKVTQLRKPYGAVISWQNINTRKEIEIALEKSLKKYRNIYNRAPVMMHSINSKAEIMSVSDFWLEKMGYERKEVIGRKTRDFLSDESKLTSEEKLKEFFKKGYLKNVQYQYVTKKGELLDVLLSATAEYDEEGNFERSLAGMVDVTELRKTERELLESRQNLIEAQRISKIGNYELNIKEGTFIPSSEVIAMMGLSEKDRDLGILEKLLHPGDYEEFVRKLDHVSKTGDDFFHIYRINHLKTKKVRWISGRGKIIYDEYGEPSKMIGTVQDISEQKVAEDKIRRLSDRILLATELAEIGVWEHNAETKEIYWDKQMYEIFETVEEPVIGFSELSNYLVEEDLPHLWEMKEKLKGGARFIEADLRLKIDDRIKYLRTYTRIIRDSSSNITRVIGVLYDNTRDKELQVKLETSLEEKNILLKEVHHRVKNNMQLVSSILALKSYDLEDDNSREIFSEINERIKSMAVIHDQLYKFYNVSEINISDYLNHIARELRVLMGPEKAKIVVEADNKLFEVDKVLLFGLIVSELVSNAFKHGFGGKKNGTVKILFRSSGDSSTLSVLNTGQKIPTDILKRKSSGLGISLIKTFTKQLSGSVKLSEENGFQITF